MIHVVNDEGAIFHVRVVLKGERYGLNDVLVHDKDDPLVQFYAADVRTDIHGPRGYLLSYYNLRTLEEHSGDQLRAGGILLDTAGGRHSTVSAQNVADAIRYAHERSHR